MSDRTTFRIRPASCEDYATAERIESVSDALFVERFQAEDWPPAATAEERASSPGFMLVAEIGGGGSGDSEIVGFVQVLEIDGWAHLEQLSVLPAHGRRGYGRMLVADALDEARRRGHQRVTLRTYAEVPWNAPFYARCGFVESEPDSPFHRRLVAVEEELGLMKFGRRVQMTAVL